jgi:hypothetical protein
VIAGFVAALATLPGGDGVQAAIFKGDGTRLWPADGWAKLTSNDGPLGYIVEADVERNDELRFVIHRGEASEPCDSVRFKQRVRLFW